MFLLPVLFLLGFAVPVGCILRVPGSVLRTWVSVPTWKPSSVSLPTRTP